MNLLLVEDDVRISEFLSRGLKAEGHTVAVVGDGVSGLDMARATAWDAVILDLMLPEMDGRELCRTLRMERIKTPIIMLTALDSTEDVVKGLRMGADDYISKPFAFEELLARLDNVAKRAATGEHQVRNNILRVEDLTFDRDSMIVTRGGLEIALSSLEFALLEYLMAKIGHVVSRALILQNVWGVHEDPLTNVVDVYIRRLRSKIDDNYEVKLIHTVRGRGYRLGAD